MAEREVLVDDAALAPGTPLITDRGLTLHMSEDMPHRFLLRCPRPDGSTMNSFPTRPANNIGSGARAVGYVLSVKAGKRDAIDENCSLTGPVDVGIIECGALLDVWCSAYAG